MRSTAQSPTELPDLQSVSALLVDDHDDSRGAIAFTLEGFGASVREASSGADALALFDAQMPDVVVADLAMPTEDGFWLIERIRARAEDSSGRVLVIALTAHVLPRDRDAAREAGFDAFLAKPSDPLEVCRVIRRLLDGRA